MVPMKLFLLLCVVVVNLMGVHATTTSIHRRVAPTDFAALNSLFENAAIRIPDTFEVNERVGVATLDMVITNLVCFEISVGDVTVAHTKESNQLMTVNIQVSDLDLTCQMDYEYSYGILKGDGSLLLVTDNNSASTNLQFESTDYESSPPKDSYVEQCVADVEISRMDFEGDLVSNIIEVFQRLVRGVVERAIGNVACQELGSIGTTLVAGMIDLANDKIEPYLTPLTDELSDPLAVERTFNLPSTLSPLLFLDAEDAMTTLFDQALEAVEMFLGAPMSDENLGAQDLVINTLIRDRFLDTTRAMVVNASQLPMDSPLFLNVHDRIFETTMTLHQVKVLGLDTMELFNPFQEIGNLTLQNELTWSELRVVFDVTVDIKPSSLEDAILQDPTSDGVSERITMEFGVENVNVLASLLLVVDKELLGSIQLGSLLETEAFLPCLLSVLHKIELVGLTADPKQVQVQEPKLSGFISSGLDRILSDAANAAFAMYTGVVKNALPNIFQTSVRDFINNFMIETFLTNQTNTKCESVPSIEGNIDFQEFFAGEQYGDIPPMLKKLLDSKLLTANEEGLLPINQALIVPFTQRQSGQPGRLEMEGDLMTIYSESVPAFGMESVQLKSFNLHLDHLDSFVDPARLLDPSSPFVLGNTLHVYNQSETLRIGLQGLFAMEGDPLLATYNDMYFSMNLGGSQLVADILTKMTANSFLTFPIRDITSMDCWLATLATPTATEKGLSLESLQLDMPMLNMSMECRNCTSVGLVNVLPTLIESLKSGGVMKVLENRLVQVGTELLRSDYTQAYIDKLLVDGSLRCPHSPRFTDSAAESQKDEISLYLPYDSLENLAFAATILMHIATVVVAESHQNYEDPDPLAAQLALVENNTENPLIDFSALNDTLGEWAGSGFDRIREYLNEVVDGDDLRINSLLRSSILTPDGGLEIKFNDLSLGGGNSEIALKQIRVMGLDSIEALDVLDVLGPQTIHNKLRFQSLALEVILSLMVSDPDASKSSENLKFSIKLEDVDVSMALFLAMSLDKLGTITFSSIMEIKNVVPCILSAAQNARITKLLVSIGALKEINVEGFRDEKLTQASADSAAIILGQYGAKIKSSMPGLFGNTVRTLVNNWMSYMIEEWSGIACPTKQFEWNQDTTFVDFRDLLTLPTKALQLGGSGTSPYGDLFRAVIGFIKNSLLKTDESTGLSTVNEVVMRPLTYAQSNQTGSLIYPGEIVSSDTKLKVGGLDAIVEFKARDARIDNLDTLGAPLKFLEPVSMPYQIDNTGSLGVYDRPLRLTVRLLVALTGDDNIKVRNEVDVSMDFFKLSVIVKSMMMVAESRFYQFPLRDVLDLNCWLATIPAPELNEYGTRIRESDISASLLGIAAAVSKLNMNVSCVECSSPRMAEFSELISSSRAQNDVTLAVNDILNYVSELAGGEFAQVTIDRILNDASRKCPHSPTYDAEYESTTYKSFEVPESEFEVSYLIMLACLAFGFALLFSLVVFGVRTVVRRRHKKWLGNLPPFQIRRLARNQSKERKAEAELNATTTSLFTSAEIPLWVRWCMPMILLTNVALFLSGHFSLGATVNIEAEVAGENFKVEKFFEFSIAKSTVDIWNAGGHELAIMILLFSGIWPYTKLFITLALWFLPPSRVSVSRRGSILLWLDWLAKWSMVDVFVLVISIVAFRVSISSPTLSFLPEGFYNVDMMVVPLWGLYANMLAQLVSQVSSHFIIYYHRRVARMATIDQRSLPASSNQDDLKSTQRLTLDHPCEVDGANNDIRQPEALRKHQFSRPHRGETETLVVRQGVNSIFCIAVVCLGVLVVIGCSVPSFSLELLGIVGVAVDFGQQSEKVDVKHSVFSVVNLLMDEARLLGTAADFLGLLTLSIVFLTTVLIIPILQSLALARQWLLPSTPSQLSRVAVFTEILQAWQYVEVYLLALFVSGWQLGSVSQYMINTYCDNLKTLFAQAVHYGVLSEDDAQCFSVQLSIESGFFYLVGGAAILAILHTFVTKAYIQYFRDDNRVEKEVLDVSNVSDSGFTNTDSDEEVENTVDAGFSARIDPVPVMFTDTFRWLLRADPSSPRNDFLERSAEHWNLPEAKAIVYEQEYDDSVQQGEYLWDDDELCPKTENQYPVGKMRTAHRHPTAASARRPLTNDDQSSWTRGSIMHSISSSSLESNEWQPSLSGRGNLKDDATYATPPGAESRIPSQPLPTPTSTPSESKRSSLTLSLGHSVRTSTPSRFQTSTSSSSSRSQNRSTSLSVHSHDNSSKVPNESFDEEQLSVSERETIEELLSEDDENAIGSRTQDTRSEYVEETLDGDEFEEYTVKTMSDILEEDDIFEDYSDYDDQSREVV